MKLLQNQLEAHIVGFQVVTLAGQMDAPNVRPYISAHFCTFSHIFAHFCTFSHIPYISYIPCIPYILCIPYIFFVVFGFAGKFVPL